MCRKFRGLGYRGCQLFLFCVIWSFTLSTMKLNNSVKIFLVLAFLACSIVGFMLKLPAVFRHHDKELHTAFYFLAAAFLNLLFAGRNVIKHALIFVLLYCFSIAIEFAQEYSNKLFRKRIHGRYDVEDVQANLNGLMLFSGLWIIYIGIVLLNRTLKMNRTRNSSERMPNDDL